MLSRPEFMQKQILFALLRDGEKVSFKNDNIVIKRDQKIIHQSSCYKLFALIIVGHTTITSGLIQRAEKFKFTIILNNYNLRPYAHIKSQTEGNVVLRRLQYQYQQLDIAQHIVANKICQQWQTLNKIRNKSDELKQTIKELKNYQRRFPNSNLGLQEILGIEGISSKVYFSQLFENCDWKGRKPRTKINSINTLLDIGYTLLFNIVETILGLFGFDLYQGVYHQTFYQRKSLVCDLMEPIRPIIDWQIRKAYQLNQIDPNHFTYHNQQYKLHGDNSKYYTSLFIQAILKQKEDIYLYLQSYYRHFMRQQNITEYPNFISSC